MDCGGWYLPTDALKIVKKLWIRSVVDGHDDDKMSTLNRLCASEVQLHTLVAGGQFFPSEENQMMQDYAHRLNSIISRSSETLHELGLDSYSMCMSVKTNLFPAVLKNVEKLTLGTHSGERSEIVNYLAKIPLAQVFPAVESVTLCTRLGGFGRHDSTELEANEIIPWPTVKKVRCERAACSDIVIKELGILFTHLMCVEITFSDGRLASCFPFRQIWSSLPHLEKLTIRGKLKTVQRNFDAEFCGIYPEEAALLRKKDDGYLKTVNIVPPFAPITYMKSKCEYFLFIKRSHHYISL